MKAEAQRVFGEKGYVLPKRDAVDTMEYTLATLKEVLRLYSVVPVVTRVAVARFEKTLWLGLMLFLFSQADDVIGSSFVPAGTKIILSIQGVHHRADLWPEPLVFRPERFLPGAPEIDAYSFLPFIQGPRNCLGQYLALLEARVVLGVLIQA